jgi:hypothetical protein
MNNLETKNINELKVGDVVINDVVGDREKVIDIEESSSGRIVTFEHLDCCPTQLTYKIGSLKNVNQTFEVKND